MEAHRSASSASRRAPQIAWQVLLSLFYLWCADAFGRSWTGRAPVLPREHERARRARLGKLAKTPVRNFRPETGSFRKSGGTLGLPCALHCAYQSKFSSRLNFVSVVSAHFPSGEPALHLGKSADTLRGLLLSKSITRTRTPSWMRAFAVYRILTTQYQARASFDAFSSQTCARRRARRLHLAGRSPRGTILGWAALSRARAEEW